MLGNLYLLCTENDLKSGDFVMTEYGILLDRTLRVKARKGIFLLNIVLQHVESLTRRAASGDYKFISPWMLTHSILCTEEICKSLVQCMQKLYIVLF